MGSLKSRRNSLPSRDAGVPAGIFSLRAVSRKNARLLLQLKAVTAGEAHSAENAGGVLDKTQVMQNPDQTRLGLS